MVGAGVVLTALQVVVTQVIRLRASACITSSRDAVRVLEIEDLPTTARAAIPSRARLPCRRNEQRRTVGPSGPGGRAPLDVPAEGNDTSMRLIMPTSP